MDKITTNDIAYLLRITTEAIRFYEKKQIIVPHRNSENSYRTFTQDDIRRLYDFRIYQSMGFSLSEISDIFREASPEKLDQMIEEKERELRRIVDEDMRALERIRQVKEANREAEYYYNNFYIRDSPHLLLSFHSNHGKLDRQAIRHDFWKYVSDYYNLFYCVTLLSAELAEDPDLDQKMPRGYGIDYEVGRELGLEPCDCVQELQQRKCVFTTFHSEPVVCRDAMVPILTWVREHGHKITGPILCRTIKITFREGKESRLYEAWVPID